MSRRLIPTARRGMVAAAAALAGSASAATLWTPEQIPTALWFDAADADTITESGGGVSQWNDKSGNGRNAVQATLASRPAYVSSGQNGLGVVSFDGTDDYLDLGTGLDWMAGTSHVAFGVLKNTGYSNLYGAANGSAGSSSLHVGFRNPTSYRINFWANDSYPTISTNYLAEEYNFMRWVWPEGAAKMVYANGKSEGTNGPNAGSISAMAGGGRIVNVVGQGLFDPDIGELVFLEGTPDQETVDKVEGYLAWKWGLEGNLPAGHPYELAGPPIPEPSVFAFLGTGMLALGVRRRRAAGAR